MSLGVREHERAVASSRWPGQAGIPGDTSGTYNQVLFIQGNPSCIGW